MRRSITTAVVFSSLLMSAGVFTIDVDTGTLTIKGNITESLCKFEVGDGSLSINISTAPTTVLEGRTKYSTYDGAVGVTGNVLKTSCPRGVVDVELSLITNDETTGNGRATASSNDIVGHYLYSGDNSDVLDASISFSIESYKIADGWYVIPFETGCLKLMDNLMNSGDVLPSLIMRVAQD